MKITNRALASIILGIVFWLWPLPKFFESHVFALTKVEPPLKFRVTMQKTYSLGEKVPITVRLENQGRSQRKVHHMFMSKIEFKLEFKDSAQTQSGKREVWKVVRDARKGVMMAVASGDATEWVEVGEDDVVLKQGESTTTDLELQKLFRKRFLTGEYVLTSQFQDGQKVENTFFITIDSEKTIPLLESLIKTGEELDKFWAARQLVAIDRERTLAFFEELTKTNDLGMVGWVTEFLHSTMTNPETPKDLAQWAKEHFEKFKKRNHENLTKKPNEKL